MPPRFRSRSRTSVWTRPPASRQTRAHMRSSGRPRLRSLPALLQAARWSPYASSGQRQLRPLHNLAMRCKGQRRRRCSRARKRSQVKVVSGLVGKSCRWRPARRPDCDLRSARCVRLKYGSTECSRKCFSRLEAAQHCQPRRHSPGSFSTASVRKNFGHIFLSIDVHLGAGLDTPPPIALRH